jgi:molybdate transport system substrate-binding protein
MRIPAVGRRALLAALLLALPALARAADIQVISSGAFTGTYNLLAPVFERETGHKLHYTYGTSMGNAPEAMPNRLARGEPADVLILVGPALEGLLQRGFAVPGSGVDLAVSRIGVAVRAGLPKPDLSTVESTRTAFLAAGSIGYSASASGTYFSNQLVQRLGIADQVLPRSRRIMVERVAAVVARGDLDMGLQQVSEIYEVLQGPEGSKITYVGPLPEELQQSVPISVALSATAKEPEAARAFIRFLASPAAHAAMRQMGLDPVGAAR